MSLDLDVVSQIMYLREGEINPGDEEKVIRFEKKISEWKQDILDKIVTKPGSSIPTKDDISSDFVALENSFGGYWCEGEKCHCDRSHWVIHDSDSNCWECMHDPCACRAPLVWDGKENAYYVFFLSVDGATKRNVWMTEPTSDMELMKFRQNEKKRKERLKIENDERECYENQEIAKSKGYCCHQHSKRTKCEEQKTTEDTRKYTRGGEVPNHCIHCDEDMCVFITIESDIGQNDAIYFDKEEFAKDPVSYNSARRKRAYKYAAFILWEGINYRRQHYKCVEDGVRALFPPLDGKTMGYKER
jgi:hypothetical protein